MMVKSVILPIAPLAAFELFTRQAGAWWPADRRHTHDAASEIFLLPTGRFYERARDGQEVELGRVRAWELPRRILLDFYIATGPGRPTEVEITFVLQGDGTCVTVTHRPTPDSEPLWAARVSRYELSWGLALAGLSRLATQQSLAIRSS